MKYLIEPYAKEFLQRAIQIVMFIVENSRVISQEDFVNNKEVEKSLIIDSKNHLQNCEIKVVKKIIEIVQLIFRIVLK